MEPQPDSEVLQEVPVPSAGSPGTPGSCRGELWPPMGSSSARARGSSLRRSPSLPEVTRTLTLAHHRFCCHGEISMFSPLTWIDQIAARLSEWKVGEKKELKSLTTILRSSYFSLNKIRHHLPSR